MVLRLKWFWIGNPHVPLRCTVLKAQYYGKVIISHLKVKLDCLVVCKMYIYVALTKRYTGAAKKEGWRMEWGNVLYSLALIICFMSRGTLMINVHNIWYFSSLVVLMSDLKLPKCFGAGTPHQRDIGNVFPRKTTDFHIYWPQSKQITRGAWSSIIKLDQSYFPAIISPIPIHIQNIEAIR